MQTEPDVVVPSIFGTKPASFVMDLISVARFGWRGASMSLSVLSCATNLEKAVRIISSSPGWVDAARIVLQRLNCAAKF